MATYFQASKALRVFQEFNRLCIAYWNARPEDTRSWMSSDAPAPQNAESMALREQLMRLLPEAYTSARQLGVPVTAQSFPAPMIGGPVVNVNLLYAAVDQDQGHGTVSLHLIMDKVNECLGKATNLKKQLLWRELLNPIWWIVEVIAYVLRIPFMILQRAGVPAKVEESIWGHIIKIGVFIAMVLIGFHYGLKLSPKDILSWLK
ncbi:MAG TPA: hypothetical protein VIJ01_16635 [Candidatus Angelobacter sp.]